MKFKVWSLGVIQIASSGRKEEKEAKEKNQETLCYLPNAAYEKILNGFPLPNNSFQYEELLLLENYQIGSYYVYFFYYLCDISYVQVDTGVPAMACGKGKARQGPEDP